MNCNVNIEKLQSSIDLDDLLSRSYKNKDVQLVDISLGNKGNYSANDLRKANPVRHTAYQLQKLITSKNLAYKTVHNCSYPWKSEIDLVKGEFGLKTFGVQTCKSVWACPVCRQKNLLVKQDDLRTIVAHWKKLGKHIIMNTYTVRHQYSDSLTKIVGKTKTRKGILGAFAKIRESYAFKKYKLEIGYKSSVRGLEVTYGKNGFHVHIHELYFLEKELTNYDEFQSIMGDFWVNASQSAGLRKPVKEIAFKTSSNVDVAEYIAKYTAPNDADFDDIYDKVYTSSKIDVNKFTKHTSPTELSSSGTKKTKNGNLSIHEIENALLINNTKLSDYQRDTALSAYYKGMKGKRQLTWSGERAFKSSVLAQYEHLKEKVQEKVDYLEVLHGTMSSNVWSELRRKGVIGIVKSLYQKSGYEGLETFVKSSFVNLKDSDFVRFDVDEAVTVRADNIRLMRELNIPKEILDEYIRSSA